MRSENFLLALLGTYVLIVVLLIVVSFLSFGIAGALMLKPVDRGGTGFALGPLLGPIGLVIAWTMRANELLERAEYEKRHTHTLPPALSSGVPTRPNERPSWAPAEAPHRFR